MPARLIAYLPEQAAMSRLLSDDAEHRVGRSDESDVTLADASVSRTHAVLSCGTGAWTVRDLGSKNGTFVDGDRVVDRVLHSACWLRFGDVHCEYQPIDQQTADAFAFRLEGRRAQSQLLLDQLDRNTRADDLPAATLRAVVELAECQRGMLMLANGEQLVVHSTFELDAAHWRSPSFAGSLGALERAVASREPLVINDISADPALRARRSVVEAGLKTLVCLPLLVGTELVGMVYADSTRPGALLTDLDTEMLEAFVERAALWIAVRSGDAQLSQLHSPEAIGWLDLLHAHEPASL